VTPGLILAAAASGSGKTILTLGLLRALRQRRIIVSPAKIGPDYIDPAFHTAASGRASRNIDPWAMRPSQLAAEIDVLEKDSALILCEGVMGLFDGIGPTGIGSTAELAARTGWPVILIVDAAKQSASIAALVSGFISYRPDIFIAGIILNKVGSPSHAHLLKETLRHKYPDLPVLGCVFRNPQLDLPSRHLGLIQAAETLNLDQFLDSAADAISQAIDIDHLIRLAKPNSLPPTSKSSSVLAPLGQRIGLAQDAAFAFVYPHIIDGWRNAGAEICFFSPLAGESVPVTVDAVFLPGGYPELHGAALAAAPFLHSLQHAANRGAKIYGECGGYMVLGRGLIDAQGQRHAMAGLLPLETSFAERQRHLGYRQISLTNNCFLGKKAASFRGHEFHYTKILSESGASSLFTVQDGLGTNLPDAGLVEGRVAGSFIHLIDCAD